MKTHDEIREAIEKVRTSYADCPKQQIAAVLHALNERMCSEHIETLAIMLSLNNRLDALENKLNNEP